MENYMSRCSQFHSRTLLGILLILVWFCLPVAEADSLTFLTPEGPRKIDGKLVGRRSSGVLFLSRDGRLHQYHLSAVVEVQENGTQPKPLTKDEMLVQLRAEFAGEFDYRGTTRSFRSGVDATPGRKFEVFATAHYVICSNADSAFSQSCGRLLERLHLHFTNYFKTKAGWIHPSDFVLVAVVLRDRADFEHFAKTDLGEAPANGVVGYYSRLSNYLVLYNMLAGPGASRNDIEAFAEVNIATVIHEATHQLSFNCGLLPRFAPNPLWLTEGMAMFFEAPNRTAGDWTGIGEMNRVRFRDFCAASPGTPDEVPDGLLRIERSGDGFLLRSANPEEVRWDVLVQKVRKDKSALVPRGFIESLLQNPNPLKGEKESLKFYGDSWALTYFLMKKRSSQMGKYLKLLATNQSYSEEDPDQRLAEFRIAFGTNTGKLEQEFRQYMVSMLFRVRAN